MKLFVAPAGVVLMIAAASCLALLPARAQDASLAPVPTPPSPSLTASPRLILPPVLYAAPGREANLYFANVVLAPPGRDYLFDVNCARGIQQEERWTWTPGDADKGDYPLTLEVRDLNDQLLASAATVVRVAPAEAHGTALTLLPIGDSLTNASVYTAELLNLFSTEGNPHLTLLGTHKGTGEGNVHEGYGGWRFQTFVEAYDPKPPADGRRRTSPFVFLENDKPVFDFPRYVRETLGGVAPDVVTVMLGTNDVFHAKDDTLEATIESTLGYADQLLAGIRAGAPQAKIGLVTTVPPSASQDAFGANYKAGQTRWQYRKNQHRLVERMLEKYADRENEKLWLVPAYLNLDTEHNFPTVEAPVNARSTLKVTRANNGVHPAPAGYRQIADSIYSWMKNLPEK